MMKRRALSLLLALSLLCGLTPAGLTASAEEYSGLCGENLRYVINTDTGVLTISGTGDIGEATPWKNYKSQIKKVVVGEGATGIGESAFSYMEFTEISLPHTLTHIDGSAFASNDHLQSIDIPEGVETLGNSAFFYTHKLRSVTLPSTLTSIGKRAFWACGVTAIDIPASVKTIGEEAFQDDSALKSLTLHDGLESIGPEAFTGCGMETLVIPASVSTIERGAFSNCSDLKTVVMLGGGKALPMVCFDECRSLERIKLSDTLESIEYRAFGLCSSLTRLDIPASVTFLNAPCYWNCKSLKTVVIPNPNCTIDERYEESSLGVPGQTVLYSDSSDIKRFAIKYGYDVQAPGSEPEDDWDPFAQPTPEPTETPTPEPTATPEPAETPTPGSTATPDPVGTPTPAPKRFDDVRPSDWFYQAVNWAVQNGITSGKSVNRFGSKDICDRSQAVFFLWAASGRPEPQSAGNPFWDVSPSAYYYKAVLWAVENNITGGTNAAGTTFSPTQDCSRGQIVTFLYAAKGRPTPPRFNKFNDIKTGVYYDKPANWAAKEGITGGTNAAGTAFSPNRKCTRAEIVSFLYKAYQ